MAIPLELLKLTEGRAPGIGVYGPPKSKKTLAAATLPPPILVYDYEGGTGCLMPWVRSSRKWNESTPRIYSDTDRQAAFDLLDPGVRKTSPLAKPAPYIDVIRFDPLDPGCYETFQREMAQFNYHKYNALVLDPMQQFSALFQTQAKKTYGAHTVADVLEKVMEGKLWQGVQERARMTTEKLCEYRDRGVFVYMTAGQSIDKNYVRDPREFKPGEAKEEAYETRGTFWVPGKLTDVIGHAVDVIIHTTPKDTMLPTGEIVRQAVWATRAEALVGGSAAYWEAGDRWGRLPATVAPNFQVISTALYGEPGARAIYAHAYKAAKPPAAAESPKQEAASGPAASA